jgi:hypothetical protein
LTERLLKTISGIRARKIDSKSGINMHVDSTVAPLRFDHCAFLFLSLVQVTFATKSGTKRRITPTRQLGRNQSEADIGRRVARIVWDAPDLERTISSFGE